jgi:hypothetical protein
MTATREQLIADWRDRLATAQAEPLGGSSRCAWLARLRIRLYSFLISLYGDGSWTSDLPDAGRDLADTRSSAGGAVFDSADVLPLAGKPARSAGKIAAVLKSVANAQNAPHEHGPLAAGVMADCWVIVASETANLDPTRCAYLLERHGILTQIVARGDDVLVHVPAADRKQAIRLLNKHAQRLYCRARHPEARRWRGMLWVVVGVLAAPLVGIAAMAANQLQYGAALDQRTLAWAFFAGCAASIVAGGIVQALTHPLVIRRMERSFGPSDSTPLAVRRSEDTPPVVLWIGFAPLFAVVAFFAAQAYSHSQQISSGVPEPWLVGLGSLIGLATFGLLSLLPFCQPIAGGMRGFWQPAARLLGRLRNSLGSHK